MGYIPVFSVPYKWLVRLCQYGHELKCTREIIIHIVPVLHIPSTRTRIGLVLVPFSSSIRRTPEVIGIVPLGFEIESMTD